MIKKIAIDIDDTVANYMGGAVPMMEKLYGLEPVPAVDGSFSKEMRWQALGFPVRTREEVRQLRKDMYIEGRLFRELPVLEDNCHLVSQYLVNNGFRVYFITARDPHPIIIEDTRFWLKKNGFWYDDVFFTDEKTKLCQLAQIPLLIDDDPVMIREALEAGLKVILRDSDWNKGLDEEYPREKLNRVETWREIPSLAEDLLK